MIDQEKKKMDGAIKQLKEAEQALMELSEALRQKEHELDLEVH